MNLTTAQRYAAHIVEWLAPYCERIEIAGSIRRERTVCNDVDVVCIPKREEIRDMLEVTGSRNLLWEHLYNYVAAGKTKFQSGGNQPGKFAILQLAKCQLDVYFAEPENFASRFICRTGSKEHNIWIAERARARGSKWEPYEGLRGADGGIVKVQSEHEFYAALGLPFIEPRNREAEWLRRNI